ncbi:MAG: hypothetical protein A3J58_01255 [Candidatus Sungbacteria bacterium RIFCSPHIGHO2_02_FULL_52_23]|uniref:EfeO-type cupredoxin-like domain-containing protein n=1 Tax=Candidatus Sungbacteria bacterium RIFCSPHIGHO2_02_FULL_52_23 TaxID=1802274 RepID=A0A1G2KV85_9BACT|nr:MAG: hypothetical protein A3J58_01255 [Candidatus Sungbacteria bacterium RIFCSPHIGHO2_02_FULL_52_23]
MSTSKKIILFVVLAITILGGILVGTLSREKTASGDSTKIYSDFATITMVADGFSPAVITVRKGTRVTFINRDTLWRWPASDIHPSHDLYPQFDPKHPIEPGEEWSFVFEEKGEWGMHDHLAPYITGKVTVIRPTD